MSPRGDTRVASGKGRHRPTPVPVNLLFLLLRLLFQLIEIEKYWERRVVSGFLAMEVSEKQEEEEEEELHILVGGAGGRFQNS